MDFSGARGYGGVSAARTGDNVGKRAQSRFNLRDLACILGDELLVGPKPCWGQRYYGGDVGLSLFVERIHGASAVADGHLHRVQKARSSERMK